MGLPTMLLRPNTTHFLPEVATTGVAGPESSEGKPVGLVYIAIAYKGKTEVYTCHFVGKRNKIRERRER